MKFTESTNRRPAALTYQFEDPKTDRLITCEISFSVIEPDRSTGYRGEVQFLGVEVTEIDGGLQTSDPSWWSVADQIAEKYVEDHDDWRLKAWEQWHEF